MTSLSTTAVRWLIGAAVAVAVMVLGAVVFGGPIIGAVKGRWFKAEQRAETAKDDASARAIELSAGRTLDGQQQQQAARAEEGRVQVQIVERHIRADPTDDGPLSDADARRLRDHDLWLCRQSPDLGGCSPGPEGDAADRSGDALPAVRPAGGPDQR